VWSETRSSPRIQEELPLATQALSGEEEEEAEEVEERENAEEHDVEALHQLLALTSIQAPNKKERNMAVLVRLSFWVACWLSGDTGAHVPANLLLADLGVPERLHFPAEFETCRRATTPTTP
jgi:hypothetical protein